MVQLNKTIIYYSIYPPPLHDLFVYVHYNSAHWDPIDFWTTTNYINFLIPLTKTRSSLTFITIQNKLCLSLILHSHCYSCKFYTISISKVLLLNVKANDTFKGVLKKSQSILINLVINRIKMNLESFYLIFPPPFLLVVKKLEATRKASLWLFDNSKKFYFLAHEILPILVNQRRKKKKNVFWVFKVA